MRDYRVVGLCILLVLWSLFLCCCADKIIEEKPCTKDVDCAVTWSMCADGVDPYHVCQTEKCANLTFVQDPCRASHICPKGNWYLVLNDSCFSFANCKESGCDDGSNETIDVCVNQDTRSEGCRYTVKTANSCASDSECVPEQCCHPTSCINPEYKKSCEGIACTMVCQGPIDCGAGTCGCVNNKCTVKKTKK